MFTYMLYYTRHHNKVKERQASFLSGEATWSFPFPNVFFLLRSMCHLEFKYNPNKNTSLYSAIPFYFSDIQMFPLCINFQCTSLTMFDWKQWHCHTIGKNSPCPSSLNTSSLFSDSFSFLPRRLFLPPLPKLKGGGETCVTICEYSEWNNQTYRDFCACSLYGCFAI